MELTPSLLALLQDFVPVFTTPTFTTFVQIVTGWANQSDQEQFLALMFDFPNLGLLCHKPVIAFHKKNRHPDFQHLIASLESRPLTGQT